MHCSGESGSVLAGEKDVSSPFPSDGVSQDCCCQGLYLFGLQRERENGGRAASDVTC